MEKISDARSASYLTDLSLKMRYTQDQSKHGWPVCCWAAACPTDSFLLQEKNPKSSFQDLFPIKLAWTSPGKIKVTHFLSACLCVYPCVRVSGSACLRTSMCSWLNVSVCFLMFVCACVFMYVCACMWNLGREHCCPNPDPYQHLIWVYIRFATIGYVYVSIFVCQSLPLCPFWVYVCVSLCVTVCMAV